MELRRPELLEQEIQIHVVNGDIGFGSESLESSGRGREVDVWMSSDLSLSQQLIHTMNLQNVTFSDCALSPLYAKAALVNLGRLERLGSNINQPFEM